MEIEKIEYLNINGHPVLELIINGEPLRFTIADKLQFYGYSRVVIDGKVENIPVEPFALDPSKPPYVNHTFPQTTADPEIVAEYRKFRRSITDGTFYEQARKIDFFQD